MPQKPSHYIPPRDNWRQAQAARERAVPRTPEESETYASDLSEQALDTAKLFGLEQSTPGMLELQRRQPTLFEMLMKSAMMTAKGQIPRDGLPMKNPDPDYLNEEDPNMAPDESRYFIQRLKR